jgi:hypothetical protein
VKSEPRGGGSRGQKYLRMILKEVSLCALGANADALLQAKARGVSTGLIKRIFQEQTRNAAKQNKHYTAQEKAALLAKAKAMVKLLKPKDELPPLPLSPKQRAKKEQDEYNCAVHARAKAIVAKHKKEQAEIKRQIFLARQNPPAYENADYFTWRGEKIYVPTFGGKKQW